MARADADDLPTRWSKIDQLQAEDAGKAWEWFLDRYQSFVCAILSGMFRSSARGARAAEEFWGYFFQHKIHARADRGRRFRAYLSGVVRRFGLDWDRNRRAVGSSVDVDDNEPGVVEELAEDVEMRLFARALIHNSLERLANGADHDGAPTSRAQPDAARMLRLFYGIAEEPGGDAPAPLKASRVAELLGAPLEANAMHKRLHDARIRFREIVVDEVRQTVPTRQDLEDELLLVFASIQQVARGLVG